MTTWNKKTVFFKRRFFVKLISVCLFIITVNIGIWLITGITDPNEPRRRDNPYRGLILSGENGKVNLSAVSSQNTDFLYIYTTKGCGYIDSEALQTLSRIKSSKVPVGVIHRLSFSQSGREQAEYFVNRTKGYETELLPAVDITERGIGRILPATDDKIRKALDEFIDSVYSLTGQMPIVITDIEGYENIKDRQNIRIWLIAKNGRPKNIEGLTVWQYSSKVKAKGYENQNTALGGAVLWEDIEISDISK